jgi:hypothetical protein
VRQKIPFHLKPSDLLVERVDIDVLFGASELALEHTRGRFEQLLLPLGDLGGVHVVDLGQLGRGLVALQRFEGHLRLEVRLKFVPSSLHLHLLDAECSHLKKVSNFRGPLHETRSLYGCTPGVRGLVHGVTIDGTRR